MAFELSPYQRDILIKTALGEARGEGVEGMADVLQVILNRANSGQFPSDPAAVALQNRQFSTWNAGEGGNNPGQFKPGSKAYQTAEQALEAIVSGQRPDPTGGALYYHTPAVSPAWAGGVNKNGTIERNGHVFYPSHPVPPGEIPSVASLLDVQRTPPSPANLTPAGAAVRQMTSPTGGNSGLQSALNQYATREGNRVTPAPVEDRVTARNRAPMPPSLTVPGAIDAAVDGLQQDSALAAALSRSNSFNGDPLTPASGPVVARIPSAPVPSASDRVRGSNGWETIATIPSRPQVSASDLTRGNAPQSGVGQSPATRTVQSLPVMPSAFNGDPGTSADGPVIASFQSRPVPPMATGVPQSYAGQERAPLPVQPPSVRAFTPEPRYTEPLNAPRAIPDRLTPSPVGLPAQYGTMDPIQVAQIGLPSIAPPAITPMPAARALALPRIAPVSFPSMQRTAPIPAPRSQMETARNGSWNGNVFTPPDRPITSAFLSQQVAGQRPPLNILVNGANTISPSPFYGSATGQQYTPGQVFNTANGQVRANEGGGFTNVETGRVSGHTVQGGMRYDPDSASFKRV